ncbi:hypothetical protein [Bradyrhizobium liaoningense]|uniref:hypothetical protein n=1 Tax=Bradyrhizobium liaoningense TaxID=43992 RepID=UPI001BA73914|nr:hypothetical protein [Bradyrhizobium liaoningense]MBR0712700.1 hypothetical protein [Bradyrhizobium liaoningense]
MTYPVAPLRGATDLIASDGRQKALSEMGADLQPVTVDALTACGMPDDWASAVSGACDAVFAAMLDYESGLAKIAAAERAAKKGEGGKSDLIRGRLATGAANAVVLALTNGDVARLLVMAAHACPIQFASLAAVSPDLDLVGKVRAATARLNRRD